MAQYYEVVASQPTAGAGSSFDARRVGPFASRRAAEDAAARLVDDPRRYARIAIVTADPPEDEDESDDS